jgi:hypothetical protein
MSRLRPNIAIYSTYCGPTANKTLVKKPSSLYPHFFYSNNRDVLIQAMDLGWTALFLNEMPIYDDPVASALQSKLVKATPHLFPDLQGFDYLFYVDDKLVFDENRLENLVYEMVRNRSPLAIRKHPFPPPNVLYEFTLSLDQPRYYAQRVQMIDYITEQLESGLKVVAKNRYWTSAILRDMTHPDTPKINEMWLEHIQKCGIQCQVSFFFVAQHFPNITLLPDNIALPPELVE